MLNAYAEPGEIDIGGDTDDGERPSLIRFLTSTRERARIEPRRERWKGNDDLADTLAKYAGDLRAS